MTDRNRRDFLKSAAAMTGAAAAATVFPESIRRALAIPANNATRSIRDVEHVVILMQENRAFDHYFGTMAGVRGYGDRFAIPLHNQIAYPAEEGRNRTAFKQWNGLRFILPYHLDQKAGNAQRVDGTPHSWSDAQAAWANGRMASWPLFKESQSMGYYEEAEVAFQRALADAFTICDAYHCGIHAGTNPNRLFHWTGTSGAAAGVAAVNNEWDALDSSDKGYEWKTYPERLEEAGVTWKVYQNLPDNFTDNPLAGFKQYRRANEAIGNNADGSPYTPYEPKHDAIDPLYKGISNTMPSGGLLAEFRDEVAAGKLPQVSWIVAPNTYSEHPGPSSPVQGAWYIQEALNALTAVPDVWSKTVFIVNFDENDGFFDHVPSPAVYDRSLGFIRAGASTMDESLLEAEWHTHWGPKGTTGQGVPDRLPYGPGPRVPCYIVSPWSRGGWVNSQVFDHTSVLRFLEARFGVAEENISPYRRAICGDLTSCFDFVNPNTEIPDLPNWSKTAADALRVAQEQLEQVPLPGTDVQAMPVQAPGIRHSRALPYVLTVTAKVSGTKVTLDFVNNGKQAAVFHVYDKQRLLETPRRYSVEAGKSLSDTWTTLNFGKYDLWVLGPNGFHRHFTGDVALLGGSSALMPEVALTYSPSDQTIIFSISNGGSRTRTVKVTANAYEIFAQTRVLAAGRRWLLSRPLKDFGNWYDYSVTIDGVESYTRRLAGRMETGKDSISDPAALLAAG